MDQLDNDYQRFQIAFQGGLTDHDSIPLDDLVDSLRGFERFFEITDSMFVRGRMSLKTLPREHRITIRVRRVGPGESIIAELEFANLLGALGLSVGGAAAWDGIKLATKVLWQWRSSVLQNAARPNRLPWNIEEQAAALEVLAREVRVFPTEDEEDDPVEIVQQITAALRRAVGPIASSVETITVRSNELPEPIRLDRASKAAIESQPTPEYQPIESGEWEQVDVFIVRVHVGTANALIRFKTPEGPDQEGIKSCTIVDPSFQRANDPFTTSLSRRRFIHVWARKVIFNTDTGAFRWELSLAPKTEQLELFPNPGRRKKEVKGRKKGKGQKGPKRKARGRGKRK